MFLSTDSIDNINPVESAQIDNFYIYSFQPCQRIRHIKIRPHFFIAVLNAIYPSDSILIYKGQILDKNKTFDSYCIKNEDKIVVLPFHLKKSNPEIIDKWIIETLDIKNFEKKINLQINSNYRKEMARIRDLKYFKSELKTPLKSDNFLSDFYQNKMINHMPVNFHYPQLKSPPSDPLPVIW